jgi:hypothetical protein
MLIVWGERGGCDLPRPCKNITVESAVPDGAGITNPRPPATWACAIVIAFRVDERLAGRNDINAPADKIAVVTKQQATEGINFEHVDGPAHLDMPVSEYFEGLTLSAKRYFVQQGAMKFRQSDPLSPA